MDLGEEEFKPITKYGVEIPNYFVAKDGRILSTIAKKDRILNPKYDVNRGGYKLPHHVSLRVDRKACPELFEDYEYTLGQQKLSADPDSRYYKRLTTDPNIVQIVLTKHRAVMEAWKPIDEYPPIPKEDWDKCPESAKDFIRETAIIDHKDDDTANNHVDNLEWSTPIKNSKHRKKQRTGV